MAERCNDCKFFDKMNSRCRRYPPQVIGKTPNKNRWIGGQPFVDEASWCGEHKKRGMFND